jgi:predicted RNase H-like nuclease (RuvC/YqgF family)
MNRQQLLYKLDDLLENCKSCPRKSENRSVAVSPEVKCKGCSTYNEIRLIGENLGRKKGMAKITLEEYQDLKAQGLSDAEIARKKSMAPSNVSILKKKWFGAPVKSVLSEEPTLKVERPKEDKTAEMRQLINDLSDTNNAKDKLIFELQEEVKELENLNAACSDIENECNSLRLELDQERKAKEKVQLEYDRVQCELEIKDYEFQNLFTKHADVFSTLIHYERKIKALEEVVKVYMSGVGK